MQDYNKSNRDMPPITVAWFFDHVAEEQDTMVEVEEEDFWEAKRELVPSVSAEELGHYERVRRAFEGADKSSSRKEHHQLQARPQGLTAQSDSTSTVIRVNGTAKGKGKSAATAHGGRDGADSSDDDFVIRTDHLAANGPPAVKQSGKGKGRGKEAAAFGDGTSDDDGLYS